MPHALFLVMAMTLQGCALYELNDDTAGTNVGDCPVDQILEISDLPCFCDDDLVNATDGEDCVCDSDDGLDCDSTFDTGLYGRRSPVRTSPRR